MGSQVFRDGLLEGQMAIVTGSVLTVDGARDNRHRPWPPQFAGLDGGQPLAEARRPHDADAG